MVRIGIHTPDLYLTLFQLSQCSSEDLKTSTHRAGALFMKENIAASFKWPPPQFTAVRLVGVFMRGDSCKRGDNGGQGREIMMGVGNRVASVIMLTFPSEPCPHADFSK